MNASNALAQVKEQQATMSLSTGYRRSLEFDSQNKRHTLSTDQAKGTNQYEFSLNAGLEQRTPEPTDQVIGQLSPAVLSPTGPSAEEGESAVKTNDQAVELPWLQVRASSHG